MQSQDSAAPLRELRHQIIDILGSYADDSRGEDAKGLAGRTGQPVGTVRRELDGLRIGGLVKRQQAGGTWRWHLTGKGKIRRASFGAAPRDCPECGQGLRPGAAECPECGAEIAP